MRTRLLVAAALASAAALGCGNDARPELLPDPFASVEPSAVLSEDERHRAAPRWERLARLQGDGDAVRRLEVPGQAIQWRVRWRCEGGDGIAMTLDPPPAGVGDLVRGRCPGRGTGAAVRGGRLELTVQADGPWSAVVEQQVDAPLEEPPLEGMTGDRLVAAGRLRPMERKGAGAVELYRLPGGRLALRLESFETTASSDLEIWVTPGGRPRTSRAAARGEHESVAFLKSTAGSQNYLLPAGMRAEDVGAIVLWCEPLYMAYASGALRPR